MTTNIQLARQVAKYVSLRSITLKSAHLESFFDVGKVPGSVSVTQQHRCLFEDRTDDGGRTIHVLAEFQFNASDQSGDTGDVARLAATFVLVYALPQEAAFDERCLKYFAELNGPYNAWPYWRELVQTATGRIGLAGIMVPLYRPVGVEVADPQKHPAITEPAASSST